MLFYVVECFSVYLENLPANPVRSMQIHRIHKQIQRQRGLVPEAFPNPRIRSTRSADCTRNGRRSVTRCRNSAPSSAPSVEVPRGDSNCSEPGSPSALARPAGSQCLKRLQNSIMQIPRNSRALGLDRPRAQMPQQEHIFQRRADVPHHALKLLQIAHVEFLFPVRQQNPRRLMPFHFHRHCNHRTQLHQFYCRSRYSWGLRQRRAGEFDPNYILQEYFPNRSTTRWRSAYPRTARRRQRQSCGNQMRVTSAIAAPHKNPLQICVTMH